MGFYFWKYFRGLFSPFNKPFQVFTKTEQNNIVISVKPKKYLAQ